MRLYTLPTQRSHEKRCGVNELRTKPHEDVNAAKNLGVSLYFYYISLLQTVNILIFLQRTSADKCCVQRLIV